MSVLLRIIVLHSIAMAQVAARVLIKHSLPFEYMFYPPSSAHRFEVLRGLTREFEREINEALEQERIREEKLNEELRNPVE